MPPPARYQDVVVSALDSDSWREENELNSAIAFAGLALEMLEAQDAEGLDEAEGSGGSKGNAINMQNDEARTADGGEAHKATPANPFDQTYAITALPILSTSFDSPKSAPAMPTTTTDISMLKAATRIDKQPATNARTIRAQFPMRDVKKGVPGQSFRVLSPSDLEEMEKLKAQKKRRFKWIKKLF